jgi:uncharacterized protein YbjT (DUF2867 family)
MKKALVIGATGLVGKQLVSQLLEDSGFSEVICFVRRPSGVTHPKLTEHLVDFKSPDSWSQMITGDVLFSCMGTTIRTAGSQEAQWEVDYTYQWNTAERAAANGVAHYVLLSAAGVTPGSRIFYNRMKGELDEAVQQLPFRQIDIIRPSILAGNRQEVRTGERIGIAVMGALRFIPGVRKYRPIMDVTVARAMISASRLEGVEKTRIHELEDVHGLAAPWQL